jgi:hypothetical protein
VPGEKLEIKNNLIFLVPKLKYFQNIFFLSSSFGLKSLPILKLFRNNTNQEELKMINAGFQNVKMNMCKILSFPVYCVGV